MGSIGLLNYCFSGNSVLNTPVAFFRDTLNAYSVFSVEKSSSITQVNSEMQSFRETRFQGDRWLVKLPSTMVRGSGLQAFEVQEYIDYGAFRTQRSNFGMDRHGTEKRNVGDQMRKYRHTAKVTSWDFSGAARPGWK